MIFPARSKSRSGLPGRVFESRRIPPRSSHLAASTAVTLCTARRLSSRWRYSPIFVATVMRLVYRASARFHCVRGLHQARVLCYPAPAVAGIRKGDTPSVPLLWFRMNRAWTAVVLFPDGRMGDIPAYRGFRGFAFGSEARFTELIEFRLEEGQKPQHAGINRPVWSSHPDSIHPACKPTTTRRVGSI